MTTTPWPEEEIRSFASIGTGSKDTQDRSPSGRYPFFVRSQKIERINSWSFDGEAVLTAGDGVGTGKVFHYINGKFDYHQRVYRISNFRADVSGRYFFHQFSRNFLARIESLTAKSSVDSVRMETIAGMWIPLPDLIEQDRIVSVIDDTDALIACVERKIVKQLAIKQGLMQQLVTGRTRLPGFSGGWAQCDLGAAATILDNLREPLSAAQRSGRVGPYPYCGANGVLDHIDDYMIDDDVILLAEDGGNFDQWATRPIAYRMSGKMWVNNHAHVLKARSGHDTGFLFYALEHRDITPFISSGTRSKLTRAELVRIEILMPDSPVEQHAIAQVLVDIDAEIEALRQRLEKARAIRAAVVQQLLTGRVRMPVETAS